MKLSYLLDTNILSDLVRHTHGVIASRVSLKGENSIFTSIFVASELRFVTIKRGTEQLIRQLELVLSDMDIIPFGPPVDRLHRKLQVYLKKKGRP